MRARNKGTSDNVLLYVQSCLAHTAWFFNGMQTVWHASAHGNNREMGRTMSATGPGIAATNQALSLKHPSRQWGEQVALSAGRPTLSDMADTLLAHVCKTERTQHDWWLQRRHTRGTRKHIASGPPHRQRLELWLCISRNNMCNVFAATCCRSKSLQTCPPLHRVTVGCYYWQPKKFWMKRVFELF